MKILNLYCGIGGNRKLWSNEHEITAVEYNESIANIYKDLYPNDSVIVADAHKYLQEHFKEFDFYLEFATLPNAQQDEV
jgi:DNA (cytosine-5)-methyltransferase 1